MSCCKDNLLVYLSIEPERIGNEDFLKEVASFLVKSVEYTEEQSLLAVEYAKKNGKCLILEGTKEEAAALTLAMAKKRISADVRTKSFK